MFNKSDCCATIDRLCPRAKKKEISEMDNNWQLGFYPFV